MNSSIMVQSHQLTKIDNITYKEVDSIEPYLIAFNDLYNTVFKRKRPLQVVRWQFLEGPFGTSKSFVMFGPKGILQGHWGLLIHKLSINGNIRWGGKNENTMITPKLKGKGLYGPFEKSCVKKCLSQGLVLWSISTADAIRVRTKSGYSPLVRMKTLQQIIFAPSSNFVRSFIKHIVRTGFYFIRELYSPLRAVRNLLIRLSQMSITYGISEIHHTNLSELVTLFESIKHYQYNTIVRSPEYMKWRYAKNLNINYHYAITIDRQSYFIYSHLSDSKVMVDDFGTVREGTFSMPPLKTLNLFEKYCKKRRCDTVYYRTALETDIGKSLIKKGYFISSKKYRERSGQMVIAGIPRDQLNAKKWFLTNVFSEGVGNYEV